MRAYIVYELMKITTMLLKASDKSILVFYKVSHFIILIVYIIENFIQNQTQTGFKVLGRGIPIEIRRYRILGE